MPALAPVVVATTTFRHPFVSTGSSRTTFGIWNSHARRYHRHGDHASRQQSAADMVYPLALASAATCSGLCHRTMRRQKNNQTFARGARSMVSQPAYGTCKEEWHEAISSSLPAASLFMPDASLSYVPDKDGRPPRLPRLSEEERQDLRNGRCVQGQEQQGLVGKGHFVTDVDMPASVVLEKLKEFENYSNMIPTVRKTTVRDRTRTGDGAVRVRVDYMVSRFKFHLPVVHIVDDAAGRVYFDLAPTSSRLVLERASGFWHVEQFVDNPGRSRLYFRVKLTASKFVPKFLIDFAAAKALTKATNWVKPYMDRLRSCSQRGG